MTSLVFCARLVPTVLLLVLGLSLFEASFRFICTTDASCAVPLQLLNLPLICESLLSLGAHRRLFESLRCLADAALGVLCRLVYLRRFIAEELELFPLAHYELQNLLIGRLGAEDDTSDAVRAILDMLC